MACVARVPASCVSESDVAADAAKHLSMAIGIAPAQIGHQGVAHQIVREHTCADFDEGQPRNQLNSSSGVPGRAPPATASRWLPRSPRTLPRHRRCRSLGTVSRKRRSSVHANPVYSVERLLRRRGPGHRPAATTPAGDRAPARPTGRAGPGHAAGLQVSPAVLGTEIAQREAPVTVSPRRIGTPRRARCGRSGQTTRAVGEARQQSRAHPVIDRRQPLKLSSSTTTRLPSDGPVMASSPSGTSSTSSSAASMAGGDGWRSRPSSPTTTAPASAASPAAASSKLVLPMPWWSVHVEHGNAEFRRIERRPETVRAQMRGPRIVAADEIPTPRPAFRQTACPSQRHGRSAIAAPAR